MLVKFILIQIFDRIHRGKKLFRLSRFTARGINSSHVNAASFIRSQLQFRSSYSYRFIYFYLFFQFFFQNSFFYSSFFSLDRCSFYTLPCEGSPSIHNFLLTPPSIVLQVVRVPRIRLIALTIIIIGL